MTNRLLLSVFFLFGLLNPALSQNKTCVGFAAFDSIGIRYSHAPGIYENPIDLRFDLPPGCRMTCAFGWDEPVQEIQYSNPIRISENTFLTIVVSDSLSKKYTYRGNYIIGRDITLPVICLTVAPDEFFPPNGIYVGSMSKVGEITEVEGNAFKKKPIRCFAEFLYNKQSVMATSCWLKTFGGLTLGLTEKSLHLVADEKLGEKEFRYKFFPEKPYNEFEHLVLRTSGSDQNATRFQDICLSSLAADMNLDHMSYQPCVLFVNDKYFGIINLREKINFDYLRYNHKAIKDSTYLVVADGLRSEEYQRLNYDLVRLHNDSNYGVLVDRQMDIENYMNFSIIQLYIANTDSRGNIRYWKSKNLDNRWRWIFYDSDLGCQDHYQKNNFIAARISPQQTEWYNPTWATHILRNLIADSTLKDRFINQVGLIQSTCLHHDTILSRIDFFRDWIKPEIPYHVKRYPIRPVSVDRWSRSVDYLKEFFDIRKKKFHEHMCEAFGLSPNRVRLEVSSNVSLPLISINSSELLFPRVDGLFYSGRLISAEAKSFFPYTFRYWAEDGDTNSTRMIDLSADRKYTAHFTKATFNQELNNDFGIAAFGTEMKSKDDLHWITLFNLNGKMKKFNDFKLHLFGVDSAITISNNDIWCDSSLLVITNHPKKWKKRFPEFKGPILKIDFLDSFIQKGTWFLSMNGTIVDSLAFDIPDSLLYIDNEWVVLQTRNGLEYTVTTNTLPDLTNLRSRNPLENESASFEVNGRLILFFVLILSALLAYAMVRKLKD